jgi:hypothetical protein
MGMRRHLGGLLAAGGLWAAVACGAQSAPPAPAPCTAGPQPAPCSAAPAQPSKSTTEKFPFPGEGGATNAPAAKPDATAPGAAGDPDAAAKKNADPGLAFPGEPAPAAGASSSSSSSSSGDDATPAGPNAGPDASGLKDKGSEGSETPSGRRLLHRVNPVGTKLQTTEEREAEDLDVAHFYTQTGDLKGAYLRTQDAVKIAPDDPDAHFALAQTALKLNKHDEAVAEYAACLKLDPDDKEAKEARKELARLKP